MIPTELTHLISLDRQSVAFQSAEDSGNPPIFAVRRLLYMANVSCHE